MKKSLGFVAVIAALGLSLSGCAAAGPTQSAAGIQKGTSLVIGEPGLLTNINSGVYSTPLSEVASADLAQLTLPAFYYHDASGALVANTAFGTVKRDAASGNVTYTLSGKARWNDGELVSPADLALSFLASTNRDQPGFQSSLGQTSLALADKITVNNSGVVIHYSQPVPDWQTALVLSAPAHVVGAKALGGSPSVADANQAIIDAATGASKTHLSDIETAFATGFVTNATDLAADVKASKLYSAGAYSIQSLSASRAILKANPSFNAGPLGSAETITLSFYAGPDQLNAAISAKQVDLAKPVASTMTTLAQAKALASKAGLTSLVADSGANEVILVNHASGSSFDAKTWGEGSQKLATAQKMLFQFLPRAGIRATFASDGSVAPTDSLVFSTGDNNYTASVNANGTSAFAFQSAELTAEEWQAAKFDRTISLRVLFDANSARGQLEYTRLANLGKLGGFDVQNVSTDTPASVLASGQWDIYIADLPRLSAANEGLATAVGVLGGFQDAKVSALVAKAAANGTLAPKDQAALDKLLVAGYYGLPLFQLDSLLVSSSKLAKTTLNASNSSVVWGYSNWLVSAKGK
ncbi:MAG: ABC transporter substrate-binding protein [Micrococcales bacterium]